MIQGLEVRLMRVLVLGSRGQLGSKVVEVLKQDAGHDVRGVDLPELDITREVSVHAAVEGFMPAWIVNCAAYTDVERAEIEPETAYALNSTAVAILADAALRIGARLLHLSTDYVFSGFFHGSTPHPYEEEDLPGPINVYGASKLAGEVCLANHEARSIVVRTSWLYGGPSRNFLGTMLKLAEDVKASGRPIRVVTDQVGSPTDAWSLALQVQRLLGEDLRGIIHASSRGETSWFGFAKAIFKEAGLQIPVEPIASADFPTHARRPAYSVLSKKRLEDLGVNVLPSWDEGLRLALRKLGIR